MKTKYKEIETLIKESSSVSDYIKDMPLIDAIKELIVTRRDWVDYALDNEVKAANYKNSIVHALSIPEREWTKEKISAILKSALKEL
jgi:hypothetical protein